MSVLHITNGDMAAEGLRASGVTSPGSPALPWRDVLHDGPVLPDDDEELFRSARGAFLAERQWTTQAQAVIDLAARDARLAQQEEAIVLWFEPDLYDQLQLVQILARIAARRGQLTEPSGLAVSIVPADCMLGALDPDVFEPLYEARRAITVDDLTRASAAWRAFTSSTPDALAKLVLDAHVAETGSVESIATSASSLSAYADDAATRMPYVNPALHRLLQEYPVEHGGLSRSERQICEALVAGPVSLAKLFRAAHHAREACEFLGNLSFAWYVERLQDVPRPLVQFADQMATHGDETMPNQRSTHIRSEMNASADATWSRQVTLTDFGREVLAGSADAIAVNGIDRWIGGVHLTTERHWRWDGARIMLAGSTCGAAS